MDEAERIAKGLSPAMRRVILESAKGKWATAKELGATGSTMTALTWHWPKGSSAIGPCVCLFTRDYADSPLSYIYQPTEIGLAVRDYLRGMDHD